LEKFTAGQANISLDNRTRIFDPTYGPGPYFGQILPRKQIVLDVDGEELFSGFVEDWNYAYPAGGFDAVAEVSATDGFAILAQRTMTAGTQTAELSGPRVTAVLDQAGWSSVKRDIGPGQSTLDADVVESTTNVLAYLQLVETSEFGALFIGRQGALTFRDRAELQAFTTGDHVRPYWYPLHGDLGGVGYGGDEEHGERDVHGGRDRRGHGTRGEHGSPSRVRRDGSDDHHDPVEFGGGVRTVVVARRPVRAAAIPGRHAHGQPRRDQRGAEGERPRPRTRRRCHRRFHPVIDRLGDQPDRLH
jgi:hypothetical protein